MLLWLAQRQERLTGSEVIYMSAMVMKPYRVMGNGAVLKRNGNVQESFPRVRTQFWVSLLRFPVSWILRALRWVCLAE